ncbi:malto-oligosyltrehalose synthase [Xanthomonas theicola]|uniref:Malto-oligosyltrehalose synthase n=1 Tax=Xanthomonas theicola TaxID=56464 RepID=A0A2S6ZJ57_9XANT|nr:malto-oligosyltrehalose synthase [Xanthomonas theicola]PPT92216.1 malto-oligosyltrehalose synthase [Xanthomonas theicola]QNH25839.1 malto-oligosyltrehalose synthase [Xanthomonas theicola]
MSLTPLRATARLQLHAGFTLLDAAAQVPYYAGLGISHLYLSPIGTAVPGSTHGYDVTDPRQVNPELGGEPALLHLSERVRAHGMGLVLDIVPNHMAAHAANPWWWDVLKHGRRSRHAGWFDIDWRAPGRDGKLWLPVLDRPYAQALNEGALQLRVGEDGEAHLEHHDQRFPIRLEGAVAQDPPAARQAWAARLNEAVRLGDDALHRLLERQCYRLAWWRVGNDMLNYRRFFDITSLAALRVEQNDVFAAVHALPLRLVAEGHLDGVRVDHVDGLADPTAYVQRLRAQLDRAGRRRGIGAGGIALYIEKILAPQEVLRTDWPCDGSTGYDFMDQVAGVLHDPAGAAPLTALWRRQTGRSGDFGQEQRAARDEILQGSLQAEFVRTVQALSAAAHLDPATREFSPQMLAQGLAALLRQFEVYRTYAGADGLDETDAARLAHAAQRARAGAEPRICAAIDAIERWSRAGRGVGNAQVAVRRIVRRRIEQLSAPLNAKSVEDTAFYRHGVLLSRNEVGSDPGVFALAPATFHAANAARAQRHPRALLATATHDHKRGEDLRMRLAVLSAQAPWWAEQVARFQALSADLLPAGSLAPLPGEVLMLWQMLVAAWPLALAGDDADGLADYAERLGAWQLKAAREAKLRSYWTWPDEAYERDARALLEAVLLAPAGAPLREALAQAAAALAPAGALNSLVQTTLRLTVPGVPDLYQGSEGWDLSLVDPDNRRPVDYALRQAWLHDDTPAAALLRHWHSGQVKAWLSARLLQLRGAHPALFVHGSYRPLHAQGAHAGHVLGFLREHEGQTLAVVVPRLAAAARALDPAAPLCASLDWRNTVLTLPAAQYRHVLGGRSLAVSASTPLADLLADFPVAVLATFP